MRRTRPEPVDVRPEYSPGQSLVAALLVLAVTVALLIAIAHPAAVAAMLLVAGAAVTARVLLRAVRARRPRQHDAKSRRLCIPATDVCLEA